MAPLLFVGVAIGDIVTDIRKFLEFEDIPSNLSNSKDDVHLKAKEHFQKNTKIAKDGKYILKLPFKILLESLNSNFINVKMLLLRMERRLSPEMKIKYNEFLQEYFEMGHMTKVEPNNENGYVLPHHTVLKDSMTTPLRVVFNASSAPKGQLSLNEILFASPTIPSELFDLLINNRQYKSLFNSDVTKMFRMVWIGSEDRKYQKILWRQSNSNIIDHFELNTITYGTVSASYLYEIRDEHPLAAKIIKQNFYINDLICGGNDIQELIEVRKIIHHSLEKRGFSLRKYVANYGQLLEDLPREYLSTTSGIDLLPDSASILGLIWRPKEDVCNIKVSDDLKNYVITKINYLLLASKIYDPIGLFSPVTIKGKFIMQEIWSKKLTCGEQLPEELRSRFQEYFDDLQKLSSLTITRYLNKTKNS